MPAASRRRAFRSLVWSAVTVAALASVSFAQAALLDRVVVSGSREETSPADTPTAIGSVDAQAIRDRKSIEPEARVAWQRSTEGYARVEAGASDTWSDFGLRFSGHGAKLRDSRRAHNEMDENAITLRGDYALSPQTPLKFIATYLNLNSDAAGSLNQRDFETDPSVSCQAFSYRADEARRVSATVEDEFSAAHRSSVTIYERDGSHGQNPNYSIGACIASDACPAGVAPSSYKGNINDNSHDSYGLNAYDRIDFKPANTRLIYGLILDRTANDYVEDRIYVTRDPASFVYTGYALGPRRRKTGRRRAQRRSRPARRPAEKSPGQSGLTRRSS